MFVDRVVTVQKIARKYIHATTNNEKSCKIVINDYIAEFIHLLKDEAKITIKYKNLSTKTKYGAVVKFEVWRIKSIQYPGSSDNEIVYKVRLLNEILDAERDLQNNVVFSKQVDRFTKIDGYPHYVDRIEKLIKNKEEAQSNVVYLDVPFEEKDAAKDAGAKWHQRFKKWYVVKSIPDELQKYAVDSSS